MVTSKKDGAFGEGGITPWTTEELKPLKKPAIIILAVFTFAIFAWIWHVTPGLGVLDTKNSIEQNTDQAMGGISSGSGGSSNSANAIAGPPDPSDNKWKTEIIDPNGNKVPKENIIDAGFLPPVEQTKKPPHLIRNGILDIQVEFEDGLKTEKYLVPDIKKFTTMVRARVYDDSGIIRIKGGPKDEFLDYTETPAGTGQLFIEEKFERPMRNYKGIEVVIYYFKRTTEVSNEKIQI